MSDTFILNNNLQDPNDIDALLELADLTRELIADKAYAQLEQLIAGTVEQGYFEAFTWVLELLQEEFGKGEDCILEDFVCALGKSIANYDAFIERLQADMNVLKNDTEMLRDENGEVYAFFNILTYRTGYANIYLISAENFDNRDNDFIQYRLSFTKN